MYLAVVGNIGAGKTTLTRMLAKHYGWSPKFESVEDNPYLEDFYADMKRWSFDLQIYFLNKRIRDIIDTTKSGETVIQDRCAFEDRYIFAPTLHEQGNLSDRDFENYSSLFDLMIENVPKPDLIIYIQSSIGNLVSQIDKRDRGCESTMSIEYLSNLNKKYNDWIEHYKGKVIIVDGDTCKFENDEEAFNTIIETINKEIYAK